MYYKKIKKNKIKVKKIIWGKDKILIMLSDFFFCDIYVYRFDLILDKKGEYRSLR